MNDMIPHDTMKDIVKLMQRNCNLYRQLEYEKALADQMYEAIENGYLNLARGVYRNARQI